MDLKCYVRSSEEYGMRMALGEGDGTTNCTSDEVILRPGENRETKTAGSYIKEAGLLPSQRGHRKGPDRHAENLTELEICCTGPDAIAQYFVHGTSRPTALAR
uniref:Uncharacterized protein n=1 Tax=Anopheles dirus TaxID=7168 RepID=A0A182N0P0_9DIPT